MTNDAVPVTAELLPCPFCGSTNIDPTGWRSLDAQGPACDDCGASAGQISLNHADNIAAWNARHRGSTAVVDELPDVASGHWETPEGREIAVDYLAKDRASLCMGELSDFHLANKQYMEDISVGTFTFQSAIAMQTAAKERIRWLSAQLAAANQKLASLSQTPATPMVQEGLREALAGHFPTGLRSLYARTAGGIPVRGGGIAVECKCGWSTVATDDDEARQQWADHVVALSATPAQEGERIDAKQADTLHRAQLASFDSLSTPAPPVDETDRLRTERDEAAEHLAAVLFSDPGPKMLASIAAARAWWLEYDKRCESALADRTQEGEVRRG